MSQEKAFPIYNQYIDFYKKNWITSVKQEQDKMNRKQEKKHILKNKYGVA